MEDIKVQLINEICKEQKFDELLLDVLNIRHKNKVNKLLINIDKNEKIDVEIKKQIYEEIYDYVDYINEIFKENITKVFSKGAEEMLKKICRKGEFEYMYNQFESVNKKYYRSNIYDLYNVYSAQEREILKRLEIDLHSELYTEFEVTGILEKLLRYYKDDKMNEEQLKNAKSLEEKQVSKEEYDLLLQKLNIVKYGIANGCVIDELFELKQRTLEETSKDEIDEVIEKNNLTRLSLADIQEKIKESSSNADEINNDIEDFIEKKDLLSRVDCKKYYEAGFCDAVSLLINRK